MSHILEINHDNFDDFIDSKKPTVVYFWAKWCNPCKPFRETLEKLATQHPDIQFGSVNSEIEKELSKDFCVISVPTTIIFREKIAVFMESGSLPLSALNDLVEQTKKLNMQEVRAQVDQQTLGEK
ncbi:MAG: thiol reductase thioredoxin [Thiotrichales bacterium]|nr:MAG: thiol reductase thioredoxin [Thiotrichales bacterium]